MTKNENKRGKPGRNDSCSCGSGVKYKFCCLSKETRRHLVKLDQTCDDCGNQIEVDVGKDWTALMAHEEYSLKLFCKENGFYWFSTAITLQDTLEISRMLRSGTLTVQHLMSVYKSKLTQDNVFGLLEGADQLHPALASRLPILKDAVEAHFTGKYSLSIPALFPQIEGFHREYGHFAQKQDFSPALPKEIWNARLLPSLTDSATFFNAYLTNLFKGGQPADTFNRNPILHGMTASYASEDWSLTLILIVLEIRLFLWFEKNTQPILREAPRNSA